MHNLQFAGKEADIIHTFVKVNKTTCKYANNVLFVSILISYKYYSFIFGERDLINSFELKR